MPGTRLQLSLAAILTVMFVSSVIGLIAVRTTDLDGNPWSVIFGAMGILAATGALILGFMHEAEEAVHPDHHPDDRRE